MAMLRKTLNNEIKCAKKKNKKKQRMKKSRSPGYNLTTQYMDM